MSGPREEDRQGEDGPAEDGPDIQAVDAADEAMTPLEVILRRQIAVEGPVSVAEFMALALGHPEHGYYIGRDPLGAGGDFITAPEISQMFGELIGLWCAQVWMDQGRQGPVTLVELGPGRGTLMADLLRALQIVPDLRAALDIHLVDSSPALRKRQKAALENAGVTGVTWHERVEPALASGNGPVFVIANEFFDALPIHQYVATSTGWYERMVGLDESGTLTFRLSPDPVAPPHPEAIGGGADGVLFERCPLGQTIAGQIAASLRDRGGAALIVDYGHERQGFGDTLQAVRAHGYHPVLERPGEADLTAHVDFPALAEAARSAGATAYGPVEQGTFLEALGITARAERLCAKADPDQAAAIHKARERLTGEDAMGRLFKALALVASDAPAPPGFPPVKRQDRQSSIGKSKTSSNANGDPQRP